MSNQRELVRKVEECWRKVRDQLEGIDYSTPAYADPLWTARDVLTHCAFWNDEATKAIEAHLDGKSYLTDTGAASFADGLDAMNQRVVEASRSLTDDRVEHHWVVAQNGFIEALLSLDDDAMARPITCPWGERKPVAEMVWDELGHETGHVNDVLMAIHRLESQE